MNIFTPKFPKKFGTAAEFREWDEKIQREYPIRYKIDKFLTNAYRHCILFPKWRLRDAKWWVLHRFHPKHRYHVHKSRTLSPEYYDTDTRILHHAFDLFAEWVENQSHWLHYISDLENDFKEGHLSREEFDNYVQFKNEVDYLYNWWTKVYPNREDRLDEQLPLPSLLEELGFMAVFDEKYQDCDQVKEWRRINRLRHEDDQRWEEEVTSNLIRLIKIRPRLWD